MTAEALYVGPPDRPRRVWRHRPAAPATHAIVVVPPFGYEAVCAHRALRHLAARAAATGLLALRVELDGTGDSAGDDLDPDRLGAWRASIADAVDLARAEGARAITLVGVRLGAALAVQVGADRDDVAAVVAIAPVVSGRRFLREAHLLQAALGLAPPPPPRPGAPAGPDAGAELVGFALTAETRAALAALDLVAGPAPRDVLVLDRDDQPPSEAWLAALRRRGAAVAHARMPGYVEMVLDPHKAQVPAPLLAAALAHAASRPAPADAPAAPADAPADAPAATRRRARLPGGVWEEAVAIAPGLHAVVAAPEAPPTRTVLFLNAGAVPSLGPNRLYVAAARRLAARGIRAVRVDLSGLGDSPPRAGAPEREVYGPHALDDVRAAVAWARGGGAGELVLAGLCSGAYHAFKAAAAGAPVDRVVLINPLTFFWRPGMSLDATPAHVVGEAARYGQRARSGEAWRKLLGGDVDVRRVAAVLGQRAMARAAHGARGAARELGLTLTDDLGAELRALAARGVDLTFLLARSDPGHALLVEGGGAVVGRLAARGALRIVRIDGPDHTFTARWTHPLLLEELVAAVTTPRPHLVRR